MRTVKGYLASLVIAVLLPGLMFGLAASWWLILEWRSKAEHEAERMAEAASTNMAEHLKLVIAAMKVVASSPSLQQGDYAATYKFVRNLTGDLGQHMGLATTEGRQLFNTRRPFGAILPNRTSSTSYTRALATGQASISNIVTGAITRTLLVTIDLPVTTPDGSLVLATSTRLEALAEVLARTALNEHWIAALVDGDGRFLARSLSPERFVGQPARPEVVEAAESPAKKGRFENVSLEGIRLITFFHKVEGTDWTVLIGMPEQQLLAPLAHPLTLLAAGGIGAVILSLAAAYWMGRDLYRAARRLAQGAAALAAGMPPPPPPRSIREFDQVSVMLQQAAALIRDKQSELMAARDAAERSETSKNRFFAAASHDLRQPLQAARLFLDTLRLTSNASQGPLLDHLDMAQTNMAQLVGELLDVARIDSGRHPPQITQVDLGRLVHDVAGECRPLAQINGLTMRVCCGPVHIASDALMLGRMLRNLIHNAIRYTDQGGIVIGCRRRQNVLLLEVWDSGMGMAPDQLTLIWDEFYQIGNSNRDRRQGLGLGLSIVARLAASLSYGVDVCSRPGKGSRFTILIPQLDQTQ